MNIDVHPNTNNTGYANIHTLMYAHIHTHTPHTHKNISINSASHIQRCLDGISSGTTLLFRHTYVLPLKHEVFFFTF